MALGQKENPHGFVFLPIGFFSYSLFLTHRQVKKEIFSSNVLSLKPMEADDFDLKDFSSVHRCTQKTTIKTPETSLEQKKQNTTNRNSQKHTHLQTTSLKSVTNKPETPYKKKKNYLPPPQKKKNNNNIQTPPKTFPPQKKTCSHLDPPRGAF